MIKNKGAIISNESIAISGEFDIIIHKGNLPIDKQERVLKLSLKELPFNVMVTGEKNMEYRLPSKWIESRLMDKFGNPKKYDSVEFTNGYGHDKPRFKAVYNGFIRAAIDLGYIKYSNGLVVQIPKGVYIIGLGKILNRWNLKGLPRIRISKIK